MTTHFLVQDPEHTQIAYDDIKVLTVGEVDKDRVCMSKFIKEKLELAEFTNGHAFYEFTREEDLEYYKEVIHLPAEFNSVDKFKVCMCIIELHYVVKIR